MADWRGVQAGLESGFQIGQKTGGKLSGLGMIIGKVANKLRTDRETNEAMQMQLDLLGKTEKIKAMYTPKEWKPQTQEEALAFEKSKSEIHNQPEPIVDKQGNIIGYRPKGSVFQPSASLEEIIANLGKDNLPPIDTDTSKKSFMKTDSDTLISQYMQKYPKRSKQEVINAMKKQGIL